MSSDIKNRILGAYPILCYHAKEGRRLLREADRKLKRVEEGVPPLVVLTRLFADIERGGNGHEPGVPWSKNRREAIQDLISVARLSLDEFCLLLPRLEGSLTEVDALFTSYFQGDDRP